MFAGPTRVSSLHRHTYLPVRVHIHHMTADGDMLFIGLVGIEDAGSTKL